MDHGSSNTAPIGRCDGRSVSELLTEISAGVRGRTELTINEWVAITAWADQNVVEATEGAATLVEGVIDTGVPIAGPGAPLVSEFNLMELIATLGRTPDGGRAYVGRVIECAWRLHGVYTAVLDGRIPPWKAERIADLTHSLNADAAAFVDRHLAAVRDPGWAQIERLVREAVIRFDPDKAEADRQAAADHRHFDIHQVDEHGLVHVNGLVDAPDGLDLDQAVTRRAVLRCRLGDESSMDVRRSIAAGELARQDLSLDLLIADEETGEVTATAPGRKVVLNVHLTDTALGQFQHHGQGTLLWCVKPGRWAVFEDSVEVASDVALEAAAGFSDGFAFGGSSVDVVAGALVVADPRQRDGVQSAVQLPVTGTVEAPPRGDLSAVSRDRRNAGEHRERCL